MKKLLLLLFVTAVACNGSPQESHKKSPGEPTNTSAPKYLDTAKVLVDKVAYFNRQSDDGKISRKAAIDSSHPLLVRLDSIRKSFLSVAEQDQLDNYQSAYNETAEKD